MRNLSIAIVAVLLSACAANGLPYPEHPASSLVVTGVAKVTIFRSDDTLLYSIVPVEPAQALPKVSALRASS